MQADVVVENHGSVFVVTPLSPEASEWVDENVQLEGWQWLGASFACEPRYVPSLIDGMHENGLMVELP
jgi:hypothetical protein